MPPQGPPGTTVAGFAATDDRGTPLRVQRTGSGFVVEVPRPGAIRFRYRLDFTDSVTGSSTTSGLDSSRLYAVARSLFVAPDPVAGRKLGRPYPTVRLAVVLPPRWSLVTPWDSSDGGLAPPSGDALLNGIMAAGTGYRLLADSAGGVEVRLAIRGRRAFGDSALLELATASLRAGVAAFGPLGTTRHILYVSDVGRKGRTSGSLQGTSSIGLVWEPGELLERPRAHDTFHETLHLWFGGAMEGERWWTEGVTDYFAARFYSEWRHNPSDLAELCYESWRNYERIPHHTSMTMAAENRLLPGGDNTVRLVYRKGMLAGLLLDAAIRRAAGGRRTLDDVARRLLARRTGERIRPAGESDIRDAVLEAGGATAKREWDRLVRGTEAITLLQVADALRTVTSVDIPPPVTTVRHPKSLTTPNR